MMREEPGGNSGLFFCLPVSTVVGAVPSGEPAAAGASGRVPPWLSWRPAPHGRAGPLLAGAQRGGGAP